MARDPTVFVHAHALCESDDVGARTRIWAFAHVMAGARLGADCNVGDHAFIETGARLGDRVTVKNGVTIWNTVTIEDDAFLGPNVVFTNDRYPRSKAPSERWQPTLVRHHATIGANATILCGLTIGAAATIGAGSVVTHDVPAHALMAGNPARAIGWVCTCGEPLDETLKCACGESYRLVSPTEGLVGA